MTRPGTFLTEVRCSRIRGTKFALRYNVCWPEVSRVSKRSRGLERQGGIGILGAGLRLFMSKRETKKPSTEKTPEKKPEPQVRPPIVLAADYKPRDDEPFMGERQRAYFRQKLLNWKEDIIRQTRETLLGLHEDSTQHADLADRATSETDRALELRARDRQRKLVSKIDAALARIED